MTKPTWDDAPDWANYMAMDGNGVWYFYASRPSVLVSCWSPAHNSDQRMERAHQETPWRESLEVRG